MEFLKGLNQAISFGISKEVYLDIWKKEMDLKLKTTEASTSTQKMDLSLVTEQMQKFSEQQQKIQEQQKNMLKQQREILTEIGKIQTTSSGYNHPAFENFKENIESEVSKLLENLSRLLETGHNHHIEELEKIKSQMVTEICSELKEAMKTTFNIDEIVAKVEEVARNIVCEEKKLMRDNIISFLQKELDQLGSDIVYDTYDRVKDELSNQFGLHVEHLKDQEGKTVANICSEVTKQVEIGIRKTLSTSVLTPLQPVPNVKRTNDKLETETDTNKQTETKGITEKTTVKMNSDPSGDPFISEWKILSISDCWKKMERLRYSFELSPEGYKLEVKAAFRRLHLEFYVAALTGKKDNRLDWPATFNVNIALNDNTGTGHKLYKQKYLTSFNAKATFKKPQPENGRTAPVLIGQFFCSEIDPHVKDNTLRVEIFIETLPKK